MIKQYFKQAVWHLRENPVISWISILGTALSICMIMVIVISIPVSYTHLTLPTNSLV